LGGTKDIEILRLTPQNDVPGQPLQGDFSSSIVELLLGAQTNERPSVDRG
jgi:hypothetical protein